MSIITKTFGGNGGRDFPIVPVRSIGCRCARVVDNLILNDISHGGTGGNESDRLTFTSDEYISKFSIRSARTIDRIEFETNKNRKVAWGGTGGEDRGTYSNVRVLGIGGKSGDRLDAIRITYIENYSPAVKVEGFSQQTAIVRVYPSNTKITESLSEKVRNMQSSLRVAEFNVSVEAAVEAEYYADVSTKFSFDYLERNELRREEEKEFAKESKTEWTINEYFLGLELCIVDLYQSGEHFWFEPTSGVTYGNIRMSEGLTSSVFDLTRSLDTYLSLDPQKVKKELVHGYIHYTVTR